MEHNMNINTIAFDHHFALEQLKNLGSYWIGPDIGLDCKVIIPGENCVHGVPLMLHKDVLPPIEINRRSLMLLNWSTRSFLAQSGIEPFFYPPRFEEKIIQKLRSGETVLVPIDIMNYGKRSVEINTALMRFFFADHSRRLVGDTLRNVIGNELILAGKKGTDWDFGNMDFEGELEYLKKEYLGIQDAISIILPLNSNKLYIPNSPNPVKLRSRKELSTVLTQMPKNMKLPFVIGETTGVQLGQNIIGVINTGAFDGGGRHIRSPLIDPGFHGNIRTEILHDVQHIELFLYKK